MENMMEKINSVKNGYSIKTFKEQKYNQTEIFLNNFKSSLCSYPRRMKLLTRNLPGSELNFKRENSVTLRQFINSCADFVLNSYIQLKLILTEAEPVINTYNIDRWSELPDKEASIDISLHLIDDIHKKLIILSRNITEDDLLRKFFDSSKNKTYTLSDFLRMYTQQCNTHIMKIIEMKVNRRK